MIFPLVIGLAIVVPFVELWVIVQVGQSIGFIPTLALLFVVSAVGSTVVKVEGLKVYRDFVGAIRRGEVPSREIAHGACVLLAGVFLLAPGFITDVLAILLLLPPVRAVVVGVVVRGGARRVRVQRTQWSGPMVEPRGLSGPFDVIDVEPRDATDTQSRDGEDQ